MIVLALLGSTLLLFTAATFLYQYIAALGSLRAVLIAIGSDRILTALWLSIASSLFTVALAIVLGIPLAYVLAVRTQRAAIIETLAIDLPQTFPPIAEGMIFLLMLGPSSPLHINLAGTFTALVLAKLFISAPFVVSFSLRRFRAILETGMNLTARSLGATPWQVFTTILLPLGFKDIAAGATLCWSRAMGELGGSLLFAGVIPGKTEIIPTFIATQASTLTVGALAATILVTTASALALLSFKRLTA